MMGNFTCNGNGVSACELPSIFVIKINNHAFLQPANRVSLGVIMMALQEWR